MTVAFEFRKNVLCVCAFTLLAVSGCATNVRLPVFSPSEKQEVDLSSVYLRGVFNWWEADPLYQLNYVGSGEYSVTLELIADGQPYDFKLSDKQWTPANTCGGQYSVTTADFNITVPLTCGDNANNVRFTPSKTGQYRFVVSQPRNGELLLKITNE